MDLKTTVQSTGLASSFLRRDFPYVVSTVHRKERGGFYQTSILKYPASSWTTVPNEKPQMLYRIEALSQLQSVQEHVDTVRMALSEDEADWLGTKAYQDDVMNALNHSDQPNCCPQEMRWTDKRIKAVISAANINYRPGLFDRFF
jgi:hypothetical protein